MEDILIIPDVHGRPFWREALSHKGEVIFLGDYTDPYPSEGISMEQAYREMKDIVDFKRENPERVTLLIGNHELHYYDTKYRCSRFDLQYFDPINSLLTENWAAEGFQICKLIGKYLFIHAGVLKEWELGHKAELDAIPGNIEEKLNVLFYRNRDAYYEVSMFRGGFHPAASPIWADIHEHLEAADFFDPEIIQIVGHTRLKGEKPLVWRNIRMIDNRRCFRLEELL